MLKLILLNQNNKDIDIEFRYEVTKNHNLDDFFKRKAETLCRFYSLEQEPDEYFSMSKIYTIKSIKMTSKKDNDKYYVHFFKDPGKNKAYLPPTKFEEKTYDAGIYKIECFDDKISVIHDNQKISFDEWFNFNQLRL